MLRIKETVDLKELEKFGFKKIKKVHHSINSDSENYPYYRCIAKGGKFIFANHSVLSVNYWDKDDSRIHRNANCKYSSREEAEDVVFDLIMAGHVEKVPL